MIGQLLFMLAGFGLVFPVTAQTEMPHCATKCLETGLGESPCKPTDFECICADSKLMASVEVCVMGTCTVIDGLAAKNITSTLCKEPVRDRSLVAPIATVISGTLALAFIFVRAWECYLQKKLASADAVAFSAWAFSTPMNVFEFFMMAQGMGKDIWTLTEQQITSVVKYTWVTQVSYVPAINLTKIAILFYFIRMFPVQSFNTVCWITMAHCFLFMTSTFIAAILACVPVADAWVAWKGETDALCYDNNAFWWAVSAINIATDLFILILPIPQIVRLQMGTKRKIYLCMMFSVGLAITIVSIVRFEGLLTYSTSSNPTYNNVMVATYSVVECNVSVICCCMPSMLFFLRRYFPIAFEPSRDSTNYNSREQYRNDPTIITIGGGKVGGSSDKQTDVRSVDKSAGGRIKKSITASVVHTRRSDSDVELMDVEENDKYRRNR